MKNIFITLLFFTILKLHGQNGFSLLQTIPTTPDGQSSVDVIECDPTGCIYALGGFLDTLLTCSDSIEHFQYTNTLYVAKYSPLGSCLWVKRIGTPGAIKKGLRVAPNGDVCMALGFHGNLYFENDSLMGDFDLAIIRLDGNGNLLWMKSIISPTPNLDIAFGGMTLDAAGNIVIAASSLDDIVFAGGDTIAATPQRVTGFLAKYDAAGNLMWHNVVLSSSYSSPNVGTIESVTIDATGAIAFCGEIVGTSQIGTTNYSPSLTLATELFIAKADNTGNVLWSLVAIGSNRQDKAVDITADPGGNYYITGQSSDITIDTVFIDAAGALSYEELYVAKINSNGSALWGTIHTPVSHHQVGKSIIADPTGNVYVAGRLQRPSATYDILFVKYNTRGEIMWTDTITGAASEAIGSIDLTPDNGILFGALIQSSPTLFSGDTIWPATNMVGVFGIHNNFNGLIEGTVFDDINGNGIQDTLEPGLPNNILIYSPGPRYSVSDINGYYRFFADSGTFQVNNITPLYFTDTDPVSPDYWQDTLHHSYDTINGINFAVQAIPGIHDIRVHATAIPAARPGGTQVHYLTVTNVGTSDVYNQMLYYYHDSTLNYTFSNPLHSQYNDPVIGWSFDTIPAQTSFHLTVQFSIPPNPNLTGTQFTSIATVQPLTGDSVPTDNSDTLVQTVIASYDPNHKFNVPEGFSNAGYIFPHVNELEYTICFQNTGNDTAFMVVLRDTIHPMLDLTSITMIDASHNYEFTIDDHRVVRWTFNQILLPDSTTNLIGSNGFVKYTIRLDSLAGLGDVITNTAYIYFDYNPPVITNTTINTIDTSSHASVHILGTEATLAYYPNPFGSSFTVQVQMNAPRATLQMTDLNGRVVKTQIIPNGYSEIVCPDLAPGIYICNVTDESGNMVGVARMVKVE